MICQPASLDPQYRQRLHLHSTFNTSFEQQDSFTFLSVRSNHGIRKALHLDWHPGICSSLVSSFVRLSSLSFVFWCLRVIPLVSPRLCAFFIVGIVHGLHKMGTSLERKKSGSGGENLTFCAHIDLLYCYIVFGLHLALTGNLVQDRKEKDIKIRYDCRILSDLCIALSCFLVLVLLCTSMSEQERVPNLFTGWILRGRMGS